VNLSASQLQRASENGLEPADGVDEVAFYQALEPLLGPGRGGEDEAALALAAANLPAKGLARAIIRLANLAPVALDPNDIESIEQASEDLTASAEGAALIESFIAGSKRTPVPWPTSARLTSRDAEDLQHLGRARSVVDSLVSWAVGANTVADPDDLSAVLGNAIDPAAIVGGCAMVLRATAGTRPVDATRTAIEDHDPRTLAAAVRTAIALLPLVGSLGYLELPTKGRRYWQRVAEITPASLVFGRALLTEYRRDNDEPPALSAFMGALKQLLDQPAIGEPDEEPGSDDKHEPPQDNADST
jgi:hypothetical protein